MGTALAKEDASALYNFWVGRVVEGDNRQAASNRLDLGVGEALVPGERKIDVVLAKGFT